MFRRKLVLVIYKKLKFKRFFTSGNLQSGKNINCNKQIAACNLQLQDIN